MAVMLRSNATRSMISAGVSTSARRSPTCAGMRASSTDLWPIATSATVRRYRVAQEPLFRRRGVARGALSVDAPRDGEELPPVEVARQRVTATVVDPVESADAVLERVAECRFPRR